jgi:hypothetical protein
VLVTTKQAAEATGLSEYELRRGYKQGIYPALLIGRGSERRRLRWNLETLRAAILQQMGA